MTTKTTPTAEAMPDLAPRELSVEELKQAGGAGTARCQNNLKQLGLALH